MDDGLLSLELAFLQPLVQLLASFAISRRNNSISLPASKRYVGKR